LEAREIQHYGIDHHADLVICPRTIYCYSIAKSAIIFGLFLEGAKKRIQLAHTLDD
jgi:mannose/cellobiose epimerase-like protein (N-acyl-D-glucosamine 2-epimerase family)